MAQITTKYSVGDMVYYPIFATATIHTCRVASMYLRNSTIYYNVVRTDKDLLIPDVPEESVLSFTEAKASLIYYLTSRLAEINNLTA